MYFKQSLARVHKHMGQHLHRVVSSLYESASSLWTPSLLIAKGAFGGIMVSKLDKQTYTSEFECHWVPLSYGPVPHVTKKLSKLLLLITKYLIVSLCPDRFILLTETVCLSLSTSAFLYPSVYLGLFIS